MSDLFGHIPPRAEFVDIRNQRPSVAEEKATLCKQLNELCRTPPPFAEQRQYQPGARVARRAQEGTEDAEQQGQQPHRTAVGHQQHAGGFE